MTENWTDDLSVFLARDESAASLVDYLLEAEQRSLVWREVFEVLTTRFALGYDDARLAVDRLQAGRVRAATGNPANEPDSKLDPIAAESYRRALNKPATRPAPDSDAWRHLLVHLESTGAVGESRSLSSDERDAVELWLAAVNERTSTRAATTLVAALKLTQLAHATMQSSLDLASKRRALLQAAVGVNAVGDTYVANRGNAGCLAEGTPAHRDAIELTEACRQLAADFERLGERTLARQAVDLRGSLVTGFWGNAWGAWAR